MTARRGRPGRAEKLTAAHDVSGFDYGKPPLDVFLQRHAIAAQQAGTARTYVICRGDRCVVGYCSLAVGAVDHANAPARVGKGTGRYPIPVLLLARLAVDRAEQGTGLGKALLKDALLRSVEAAEIAGIRALLVHAQDDEARSWYERFDFEPSPTDPYHLFLLMKDLRAALAEP